jgi:REP element-mobilizing transposase RayT
MPRGHTTRPWLQQCCYHVSNTCYSPAEIFRYANARQRAVNRLRELKDRFPVRLLDYVLLPDGYRLLVEAEHPGHVSDLLRCFHLGTTHDYTSRKQWDGPVWRPRPGVTLVEKGPHALRCALDMDFEMVRTGKTKWFHPLLWNHSGHRELSGVRKRYRLLHRQAIRRCLIDVDAYTFREWYIAASNAKWNSGEVAPEPWWHSALIVGSRELCETIADTRPPSWLQLKVYPALRSIDGLTQCMCWTVNMSRKRTYEYTRSLIPKT